MKDLWLDAAFLSDKRRGPWGFFYQTIKGEGAAALKYSRHLGISTVIMETD
jgi:hypothetical protein